MVFGDTIAAIATAPGRGGVAIIRVSGSEAYAIARSLTGRDLRPGRVALRDVIDGGVRIDQAVVIGFQAPHSYTGEDVVEFQCHGGSITPRRILEAALRAGARLARRGEFTQRAFLNGHIDYDQAESVLDLVDAKTVRAADAALEGLSGRRRQECRALYERALDLSSVAEHALDVDEGELPDGFIPRIAESLADLRAAIGVAIVKSREGKILREGALVVLAGPPNAGKSSLMNALLKENRAIVSDIPGTTRDSIEEWLDIDGWPIRLVDTAGLRRTSDEIEAEGVRRSEELMARADLVLQLGGDAAAENAIRVHSKCDLGRGEGLNVSATTGEGLDALKSEIVNRLRNRMEFADEDSSRDAGVLHEAQSLLSALPAVSESGPEGLVLVANAVRLVADKLGSAIGAVYSEDLLDRLFSRFCVGK